MEEDAAGDRAELEHDFLDSAKSFQWDDVRRMLKEKPDLINVQPCGRWTALHQAAFEGNVGVAKELLDLGADPQATNRQGATPYSVAKGEAKKALESAAGARGGPALPEAEGDTAAAGALPEAEGDTAAAGEPPMKKARAAKKKEVVYTMNINEAVDKEYEECSLQEIASAPISAIQGISDRGKDILKKFKVRTIRDLARWKFYRMSKAMVTLGPLEQAGKRGAAAEMNINKAMDKKHHAASLGEMLKMPPSALNGIAPWADAELAKLHVKTIGDLGDWKFAKWSEAITDLAEFESEDA